MRGTHDRNPCLLIVGRARECSTHASKILAVVAPSTLIAASIPASDRLATSVGFRAPQEGFESE
jgi:hypothetical protein